VSETATTPRAALREPIKGDLTQGPILKTLLVFSVPTLVSNLLQTVNGTINSIFVGQLLGEGALAATANANIVMFMVFATVFGLGMATTIRVGQHFGAREIEGAKRTYGSGTGFCAVFAALIAVLGWVLAPSLLIAMSTPPAIEADALIYLRVLFLSMPLGAVGMIVSMGLRGIGDANSPLLSMAVTLVLNAALNVPLIAGWGPVPALGIAGSAWASAIANLVGLLVMLATVYRRGNVLALRGAQLRYFKPARDELKWILGKGVPMGMQMIVVSLSAVILVGLVNREGMMAAAAYGAMLQLWNYVQMPAFGIGTAVSSMVAQAIGAGDHARVGKVTWVGVATNFVVTGSMTVLLLAFDRPLLALFLGNGSAAIPLAIHIQEVCTWTFVLSGVMMMFTGTMRAYGAVILPLLVLVVSMYPARFGFYYATYDWLGAGAIWWSYPFGSVVALVLTWLAYRYGGWRRLAGRD
jgi:putative MATE family efflux protein